MTDGAAIQRSSVLPGMLRLSWAEWRAHPARQLVACAAIALGVALAYSVHLINASALAEFASAVHAARGEPDLRLIAPAPGLPDTWADRLAAHPAVQQAHPRVEADTLAALPNPDGKDGTVVPLRVIGVDALQVAAVAPQLLPQPEAGSDALSLLDPSRVYVNASLAQRMGDATTLRIRAGERSVTFQRAGTIGAGGGALAVVDIAAAQALFGRTGWLSSLDLRLAPGADVDALLRDLQLPPTVQIERPEAAERRAAQLSLAYRVNLDVLALVALVVGAFLVYSVVALSMAQRTPGFALLGVLGLAARERQHLVLAECAITGLLSSAVGVAAGAAMAGLALRWWSGDLGGGYFGGQTPPLRISWAVALGFVLLGTVATLAGGWWPARQAARLAPAVALKGLGAADAPSPRMWPGALLVLIAAVLALLPPVGDLPLAAYLSVAAGLVGGIALVPAAVRMLLVWAGRRTWHRPLWLLALSRAQHQRSAATAVVSGVVASLALCVALTVMVASFRNAVAAWLDAVLPADLYVRAAVPGSASDAVAFPPRFAASAAQAVGVVRAAPGRSTTLSLAADKPDVWLLARELPAPAEQALPLVGPLASPRAPGDAIAAGDVYVSEAMVALYGAAPGSVLTLPLGGRQVRVYVRGVWRDYARQFGSVLMTLADYQRLTGDAALNELALWLAPDAGSATVEQRLRALADASDATGHASQTLSFATTAQLRRMSLTIFDRSFAVTRYLQAVAIVIGLVGVAASLSAQVLARRREFGLLAHLGMTRGQVVLLVGAEAAAWLAAGVAVGVLLGVAISAVLVFVVNPQSFHWTMDLQVPHAHVAVLAAVMWATGVATALWTARRAALADAVRAVREDW